jgi:hypothetical protein
MINEEELKLRAVSNAEQNGIVFIDEIDKIARRQETAGADVSREGVQRDLLPLVEGCTVNTKYGTVKTDHVLFIASGAFHMSKPSDLIPELQGRLPIRVELEPLKVEDFVRILTEPDASLCRQYSALLATEGVEIKFEESGVRRLAEVAFEVNETTENIGARRLHTVMERLLETVSFDAADRSGSRLVIDRAYVESNLGRARARSGSVALHPVAPHPVSAAGSMPQPTEIKLRTRSRILEVSLRRRHAFRAAFRVPAGVLAFRRGHRTRRRRGRAADRERGGRDRAHRAGGQLRAAAAFRRRPQHGAVFVEPAARARRGAAAKWARYLERCAEAGVKRKQ